MKIIAITFLFSLGAAVALLSLSIHRTTTALHQTALHKSEMNNCGCESEESRTEFPYANRMDPQRYRELYREVEWMPDEKSIAGNKRRGGRTPYISTTQWESFGPLGVTAKDDPGSNLLFGRIRCILWYQNPPTGLWEIYLGASSGGVWYGHPAFTKRPTAVKPSMNTFSILLPMPSRTSSISSATA